MEFKLNYRGPVPNENVNLLVGPTREGHRSKKRSTKLPDNLTDYHGQNLVFIVGPPRSGTTWVLKLLSEHPDVMLATADNLGLPSRGASTETGIFTTGLNTQEIKARFLRLSRANKGKVIVEKTPVHLFYVPQILKMFPMAAIVMTRRGGRDTVASILAVGRKKDSWWKEAPGEADAACRLWKDYAIASSRCEGMCHPYVIRYEDLHDDPNGILDDLVTYKLGLSDEWIEEMVDRSRDGANIKTEGVFRKGQVGGWRDVMTDEDVLAFEDIAQPFDWQPLVDGPVDLTVILSSFERPAGLLRSFRSLLKQTISRDRMEIIICDDGSEKPKVQEMLTHFRNNHNLSILKAPSTPVDHKEKFCTFTQLINRALTCARGRYITYLTDGDVYVPNRCKNYVAALDKAPKVDLVWGRTRRRMFDKKREGPEDYQTILKKEAREHLPWGNFIDHNAIMHRRSHVRWSTSPDSWRFADWMFLQRMLLDGATFMPLKFIGQTLYITENSLGQAMGVQEKSFGSVISKRRTGK